MKLSIAIATAMAASAFASPFWKDYKDHHKGKQTDKWGKSKGPFDFTSTWEIIATPDQVVDMNNAPTGGLAGAKGIYRFGLNSHENTICYNITLYDFRGDYVSPAVTATHIHQAEKGKSGPPRIAFPNPQPIGTDGKVRRSIGCQTGPFKTGLPAGGPDSGAAFQVKQIEENPKGFFADVHSSEAVPGAVRGQFA